MDFNVYEVIPGKPVVIMTLKGLNPALPSLLLNSHTDVVPVTPEKWTHDPFSADLVDGKVYARGSQDMKSVGMGYIEAIRRLRASDHKFERTVHLSFVPDEEIGGRDGMEAFIKTDHFKLLNVGFALDEGIPAPFPTLLIFNSERSPWCIPFGGDSFVGVKIIAKGNAGHGSVMLQGTAVERLLNCLQKVRQFRVEQLGKLCKSDNMIRDAGKFTSVNITMLKAGQQTNVIPDEAIAYLDIRVANDLGEEIMLKLIANWTADEGLSYEFQQKNQLLPCTSVDDHDFWWMRIRKAIEHR